MQTFLPYADYEKSAEVLDYRRLGKQRVETLQILNVLHETNPANPGWRKHPAVLMWKFYEAQLCEYGLVMCDEWVKRGYRDIKCRPQIEKHLEWATGSEFEMSRPPWFGDEEFHRSHQSNLLRKDETYYRQYFGPDVPTDLEYVWPVSA